jgi:hypothetical protein
MGWLRASTAFPLNVAAMFNLASADKVVLAAVKRTDQQKVFVVRRGVNGLPSHSVLILRDFLSPIRQTLNFGPTLSFFRASRLLSGSQIAK